jgi:hypothetical protein
MNAFTWIEAKTAEQAVAELSSERGGPALLKAGGVDVLDRLKEGLETPERLVNISRLGAGMREILVTEAKSVPPLVTKLLPSDKPGGEPTPRDCLKVGALATLAQVASHPHITQLLPALSAAASGAATPQVRQRRVFQRQLEGLLLQLIALAEQDLLGDLGAKDHDAVDGAAGVAASRVGQVEVAQAIGDGYRNFVQLGGLAGLIDVIQDVMNLDRLRLRFAHRLSGGVKSEDLHMGLVDELEPVLRTREDAHHLGTLAEQAGEVDPLEPDGLVFGLGAAVRGRRQQRWLPRGRAAEQSLGRTGYLSIEYLAQQVAGRDAESVAFGDLGENRRAQDSVFTAHILHRIALAPCGMKLRSAGRRWVEQRPVGVSVRAQQGAGFLEQAAQAVRQGRLALCRIRRPLAVDVSKRVSDDLAVRRGNELA